MSQGIPTVCISKSRYYDDKFLGLRDQFGAGCEVVNLDSPDAMTRIGKAIECAWTSAPYTRSQLLEAAGRQAALSQRVYKEMAAEILQPASMSPDSCRR